MKTFGIRIGVCLNKVEVRFSFLDRVDTKDSKKMKILRVCIPDGNKIMCRNKIYCNCLEISTQHNSKIPISNKETPIYRTLKR